MKGRTQNSISKIAQQILKKEGEGKISWSETAKAFFEEGGREFKCCKNCMFFPPAVFPTPPTWASTSWWPPTDTRPLRTRRSSSAHRPRPRRPPEEGRS